MAAAGGDQVGRRGQRRLGAVHVGDREHQGHVGVVARHRGERRVRLAREGRREPFGRCTAVSRKVAPCSPAQLAESQDGAEQVGRGLALAHAHHAHR